MVEKLLYAHILNLSGHGRLGCENTGTVTVTAKAAIRKPILYELWKTISCSRSPASLTMRDPGGLTTARYDRCRSHIVCKNELRQAGDRSIVRVLNGCQLRRILLVQDD